METNSETYGIVRNKACVTCGADFTVPRAGKLYCSSKCKQFAQYHKSELNELRHAKKGLNSEPHAISLKEYNSYSLLTKKINEYKTLLRRSTSSYISFDVKDSDKLKELEKELPQYLKEIKLPTLSIEEWSFLKILYPHLKKEEFYKLLSSFNNQFYQKLSLPQSFKTKTDHKFDPIQSLYCTHVLKIVEGRILFV